MFANEYRNGRENSLCPRTVMKSQTLELRRRKQKQTEELSVCPADEVLRVGVIRGGEVRSEIRPARQIGRGLQLESQQRRQSAVIQPERFGYAGQQCGNWRRINLDCGQTGVTKTCIAHIDGSHHAIAHRSRAKRAAAAATHDLHCRSRHITVAAIVDRGRDNESVGQNWRGGCATLDLDGDILPLVEKQLGIVEAQQELPPVTQTAQFTHQADFGVEDATPPLEARLERIKQWREIAVRGSAGQKFRNDVRKEYDFRCIFSGDRLPKTEATESAGVDAAHILPWSTHNINSVSNGICLNKLCHWALDAGAVKLSFDNSCGAYVVEIPDKVRTAATKVSFDLDYFDKLCGKIPASRLPKNKALWPSPKYLDELNNAVFAKG